MPEQALFSGSAQQVQEHKWHLQDLPPVALTYNDAHIARVNLSDQKGAVAQLQARIL